MEFKIGAVALFFHFLLNQALLLPVWKICHIALALQVHKYRLKIGQV